MSVLIQLVADYAPWIYGLCGLLALWYLREAFLARRERRQAMYTLEREAALDRIRSIYRIAFFMLAVMAVVYYISNYLVEAVPTPTVEEEIKALTPTAPLLLPTPTPTPVGATPTPTVTPTRRPRPTKRPTPLPTATEPAVQPPDCPDPRCRITWPGVNAVLQGAVQVTGSAYTDGFQYYKLEFGVGNDPNPSSFILRGDTPVHDGVLGTWDVSVLPPGVYTLQLKVVDYTGNWVDPPCKVLVTVGQ